MYLFLGVFFVAVVMAMLLWEGMRSWREKSMSGPVQQCRSCGRGILWLKHERTGNKAPIERIAVSDGNIAIDEERGTYRIVNTVTERDELVGRLYVNHFARCPQSLEHRRR